jgi:hypothetical protein
MVEQVKAHYDIKWPGEVVRQHPRVSDDRASSRSSIHAVLGDCQGRGIHVKERDFDPETERVGDEARDASSATPEVENLDRFLARELLDDLTHCVEYQ